MRQFLLALAVGVCGMVAAETIVLDLSQVPSVEYDATGLWTEVFNHDAKIVTDDFVVSHAAPYDGYSNGFFASKVSAISASGGYDDQWGCMARGGISGEGTPFLGAYWDSFSDTPTARVCEIVCASPHYAVGFYVCNSPYVYYSMRQGSSFSKKFEQGDWLKLVAHGVDSDAQETGSVEIYLADCRSENTDEWTMLDTWKWVNVSSLGKVASVYFTMESSDVGDYGMNTPAYFCIDRFTISTEYTTVEDNLTTPSVAWYDRQGDQVRVRTKSPIAVAVYAINGTEVWRGVADGEAVCDMSDYPTGVYVVRYGDSTIKIMK